MICGRNYLQNDFAESGLHVDLLEPCYDEFPACRVTLRVPQPDVLLEQAALLCCDRVEPSLEYVVLAAVLYTFLPSIDSSCPDSRAPSASSSDILLS